MTPDQSPRPADATAVLSDERIRELVRRVNPAGDSLFGIEQIGDFARRAIAAADSARAVDAGSEPLTAEAVVQWIRNNYQDYLSVGSLTDALREHFAARSVPAADAPDDKAMTVSFQVVDPVTLKPGHYEIRFDGTQSELVPVPAPAAAGAGEGLTEASRDVLAERQRQVSIEGWTSDHDDEHKPGELALAAACYVLNAATWLRQPHANRDDYAGLSPINWTNWPWAEEWWKPKDERRDLIRAGALILAEIERIDRAALSTRTAQGGQE